MTEQTPAADTHDNETPATDAGPKHGGTQYLLVGGAALATMAFVVGLWMLRGGSVDMLLGEEPATAAAIPVETPATPARTMQVTRAPQPAIEMPAVAATATPKTQPGQPLAIAPNGMPVFAAPHGVVNPLTMWHDPAYYQQWGRVGATFINPLAYQQIMFQMLRHSMQAWGLGQPVTVAVGGDSAPRG